MTSDPQTANASGATWVFGLSVDETIEWQFRRVYKQGARWKLGSRTGDRFPSEPRQVAPPHPRYGAALQGLIRASIVEGTAKDGAILRDQVEAIGVSIVGSVDRENLTLTTASRIDWIEAGLDPIISFRELFQDLFRKVDARKRLPWININNDATAKCYAEWQLLDPAFKRGERSSLFFIEFSGGLNGAFVFSGGQSLATAHHTELGHVWPLLHRTDLNFDPHHSGCATHTFCLQGVCSTHRVSKSWADGKAISLSSLPREAHRVIAFYLGQMCLNGVLAFTPERISIGGSGMVPELVEAVRSYFNYFNGGKANRPLLDYKASQQMNFIQMAKLPSENAGMEAALELARRTVENDAVALRSDGRPRLAEAES